MNIMAPNPGFKQQVAEFGEHALRGGAGGSLTSTTTVVLGIPRFKGRISNAYMSVGASGKDDANALSVELDVQINGTTAFTTKPKIEHVSGEASQHKTTLNDDDTGVTLGVLASAITYSPGDVITGIFTLVQTSSPTTEISNPAAVVELMPD